MINSRFVGSYMGMAILFTYAEAPTIFVTPQTSSHDHSGVL